MIQDIFEMPFPLKKDITFSSTVPLILYNEGLRCEDYHWFGRNVDIQNAVISNFHRYKFLEYVGDFCVERVIVSENPIDINADWSKDETPIIPLYAKRYDLKHGKSFFDRYLCGCWTMLENLDMCEENLQTIHEKIMRHLHYWRDIPGLKTDEYYDKIITGKTSQNIENFRATLECTNLDYDWDQPFYTKLLKVPEETVQPDKVKDKTTHTIIMPDAKVKDLNKIKERWAGLWNMGVVSGNPARLFDPNGEDVQYGFNNDYSKWEQIGILDDLFWSNMTDIYLDVEFVEKNDFKIREIDMLNRYTGFHVDQFNSDEHDLVMKHGLELIFALSKCAMEIPAKSHHLERLRVQMNWWDEIYIELYLDGKVHRYWFDTSVCTLADPAILTAWD